MNQQKYCICRSSKTDVLMICCDKCNEWFHGECISLTTNRISRIDKFYCRACLELDPQLKISYFSKIKKRKDRGNQSDKQVKRHSPSLESELLLPPSLDCHVLVIGAGISGLAATRVLKRCGLRVITLEARHRVGGRINTVTLSEDRARCLPSVNIDLGANYMHGCSAEQSVQPVFCIAARIGLKSVVTHGDILTPYRGWENPEIAVWRDHTSGAIVPREEIIQMTFLFDACLGKIIAEMPQLDSADGLALGTVLDRYREVLLGFMVEAGIRQSAQLSQRERGIFDSLVSRYCTYVNPAERTKASSIAEACNAEHFNTAQQVLQKFNEWRQFYLSMWGKSWKALATRGQIPEVAKRVNRKGEDRLVTGGFQHVPAELSRGVDVRFNQVARRIEYSGDEVVVTVQGGQMYRAKSVIITVPVGVLKGLAEESRIEFIPQLPAEKVAAINRLGIPKRGAATHDKVVLLWEPEDIFWDDHAPALKCPDPRLHILNYGPRVGRPGILLCHVFGGSGLQMANRPDHEIVNELLTLMAGMYPDVRPLPRPYRTIVTRWSSDAFSLGSYTAGEVGSTEEDRKTYRASLPSESTPRLSFAGEATLLTHEGQECTHGAFNSGVERARQVLLHLTGNDPVPVHRIVDFLFED